APIVDQRDVGAEERAVRAGHASRRGDDEVARGAVVAQRLGVNGFLEKLRHDLRIGRLRDDGLRDLRPNEMPRHAARGERRDRQRGADEKRGQFHGTPPRGIVDHISVHQFLSLAQKRIAALHCRCESTLSARQGRVLHCVRVRRFLILATILVIACHRKPPSPPDVIARVGERMVSLGDFKRYLERNAGTDLAQVGAEGGSAMLDQYVEEIVLSEYAANHGVEIPAEKIAAAVRTEAGSTVIEKRDEMRRQKLIADLAANIPQASDAEIRTWYEQHPSEFRSGEEVHVRQILVHDEATADDIAARLKKGESFEDLSRQFSLAPNAKKGGEIGYISRGELPKMFEDEIFALKPGSSTGVIRTENSFHIFHVDERRPPGVISLVTAAPVIRERLRDDGIRENITQNVARARAEMPIAVLTKRLPFRYSGTFPRSENE